MKTSKLVLGVLVMASLLSVVTIYPGFVEAQASNTIYLPLVEKDVRYGFGADSKFIGIYMQTYWTNATVTTYMPVADSLAGKKHSVTGWFIDIQDPHPDPNLNGQLEALWSKGYISFINLNSTTTAYEIASGQLDSSLRQMAEHYASWIGLGGGRKAFLAPLPEMNGVDANGLPWTSYGGNPANFKLAYQHIMDVFSQRGVSRDQVWWVFAPNGWSMPGHEFENYYPGDTTVDVVAFSMYNYGFCSAASPWYRWENYDTLYAPYISRIYAMAPGKPIIIAQTGTTAEYAWPGEFNTAAKNSWLSLNYEYLSIQEQVLGILYYDFDQSAWECNWKITVGNTFQQGYKSGASHPPFQYLSWQDLQAIIP